MSESSQTSSHGFCWLTLDELVSCWKEERPTIQTMRCHWFLQLFHSAARGRQGGTFVPVWWWQNRWRGCMFGHHCRCRTRFSPADLRQAAPHHWKLCAAVSPLVKSRRVSSSADWSTYYREGCFPQIILSLAATVAVAGLHPLALRIASCMGQMQ